MTAHKRHAYAVFAGGGIKGAALGGCLLAAHELRINFVGYAGSSAGAIVALLANAGCEPEQIKRFLIDELDPMALTDDGGIRLNELRRIAVAFRTQNFRTLRLGWASMRGRGTLSMLQRHFGAYSTKRLRQLLDAYVRNHLENLDDSRDISFNDLRSRSDKLLKIVVSNVNLRQAQVHSALGEESHGTSVIDAVCASACYPFMFQPVRVPGDRYLVDGGLCSNLPIWTFAREQEETGYPIIAFDLVQRPRESLEPYRFTEFCSDLLNTALDASDSVFRGIMPGVVRVKIDIPADIDALDLNTSRQRRLDLFNQGYASAREQLKRVLGQWNQAVTRVESLQATYAPAALVETVLAAIARDFSNVTKAKDVNVTVFVPDGEHELVPIYRHGSAASALGVLTRSQSETPVKNPLKAAWENRTFLWADWNRLPKSAGLHTTSRTGTLMVAPIFDISNAADATSVDDVGRRALLVVDTTSSLADKTKASASIINGMKLWADVVSKVLR